MWSSPYLDARETQIPIAFSEEYGLHPNMSVELYIDLILRTTYVSRIPYYMTRMELKEII